MTTTLTTLSDTVTREPAHRVAWQHLQAERAERYRMHPDRKVRTEEQALAFLNDVGCAFLFPQAGVMLPSLWDAINGRARDIPGHHHDHALSLTWNWKDSLPARKAVWYGKLVKGKPTFVSLDLLPAFYALSSNYGELDDYLEQYADGRMSKEARTVYETLLANGPSSTNALRKATGMFGGGDVARRFERAIAELQADLKIVKCGTAEDNRWKYCYVYDLLLRWHPAVAEQARTLSGRQAMTQILTRYLRTVIAAPAATLAGLFGWEPSVATRLIGQLLEQGDLAEMRVEGVPAAYRPRVGARRPTTAGDETWLMLSER
jgi:hypothetical protein